MLLGRISRFLNLLCAFAGSGRKFLSFVLDFFMKTLENGKNRPSEVPFGFGMGVYEALVLVNSCGAMPIGLRNGNRLEYLLSYSQISWQCLPNSGQSGDLPLEDLR
jgi:hypothetical protein